MYHILDCPQNSNEIISSSNLAIQSYFNASVVKLDGKVVKLFDMNRVLKKFLRMPQLTDELEVDADDLPLLVADDGHEVEGGNFTHSGMLGVWLKVIYRVNMVVRD